MLYNYSKRICGVLNLNFLYLLGMRSNWTLKRNVKKAGNPNEWSNLKVIEHPNPCYEVWNMMKSFVTFWYLIKASAHSFKRFTSRPLLKYLSLYAPITSDECHSWLHLNAANPTERKTEQVNITNNLVHGRIRPPKMARPPDYKSTVFTTRPIFQRYECSN